MSTLDLKFRSLDTGTGDAEVQRMAKPRVVEGDAYEALRAVILHPGDTYALMRELVHRLDPLLDEDDRARLLAVAMWAGNVNALTWLAGCGCCCEEHTHDGCPARAWHGCRGQYAMTYRDLRAWADHYGMSVEDFTMPNYPAT